MAGNKHKNGIVCVFPGCEKKMRTQKFKGHFVKAHLREGEEYTVDHRRQFEVAQSEPLPDSDVTSASASPMDLMGVGSGIKVLKSEPAKRVSLDAAKKATDALMVGVVTHPALAMAPDAVRTSESDDEDMSAATASELPVQQEEVQPSPVPVQMPTGLVESAPAAPVPSSVASVPAAAPAPAPVRAAKRPAAAITPDVTAVPNGNPSLEESTMVKMLLLMDRRFNELAHKMDEMMEMQRLLFSAIMTKDSMAAAVDEHEAKKRKDSSGSSSTIV